MNPTTRRLAACAAAALIPALTVLPAASAESPAGSSCAHPLKLVVHHNGDSNSGDHRDISAIVSNIGIEWTTAGSNYRQIVFCEVKGVDTDGKHWRVTGHPQGWHHSFAHGALLQTATITARLKVRG